MKRCVDGLLEFTHKVDQSVLFWLGYMGRMNEQHMVKRVMTSELSD